MSRTSRCRGLRFGRFRRRHECVRLSLQAITRPADARPVGSGAQIAPKRSGSTVARSRPDTDTTSRIVGQPSPPPLDELVIVDGLALRLLVALRLRRLALAQPLGRVLLLVEARTAAPRRCPARSSADCILAITWSISPARRSMASCGRERTGVHVADLLPPDLRELRVIRHVDPGRAPSHAVG